ncbi:MAG: hypothetical protein MZU97_26390 [Bacillus subtilis]|nr:hypothetical protein [Bacillus subtilis]
MANYGHQAYFVSKVPAHEVGQAAIERLDALSALRPDYIVRGGERLGIYFLETGASMRPSKVIYDRANSAIALAEPAEFDFDTHLRGRGLVPLVGDHPGARCESRRNHQTGRMSRREEARRQGLRSTSTIARNSGRRNKRKR